MKDQACTFFIELLDEAIKSRVITIVVVIFAWLICRLRRCKSDIPAVPFEEDEIVDAHTVILELKRQLDEIRRKP